ncbi:MAG: hypothetical protein NTU43_13345 [Bacteroidetes bacterium]|nr:hypothetical protein [Bacteroidota bacterium]
MKKLCVFSLLISILASSCLQKNYESLEWQSASITTDGHIDDWSNPLRFYDYKSKINYSISNDLQNIYLCIKISDRPTQMKILRAGMEFKIDPLGKSGFPVTFMYPLSNQNKLKHQRNADNDSENKTGDKQERTQMMKRYLLEAKNAQLIGFKPEFGTNVSLLGNSTGIMAAINIDNVGIMCYEAVIPFETFYKKLLSNVDSNLVFNYEIKINAMPAPSMNSGGGYNGGGSAGGMGGRGMQGGGGQRAGGMRGVGSQGGSYNSSTYSEMYNANEIKMKMKFALGDKPMELVK